MLAKLGQLPQQKKREIDETALENEALRKENAELKAKLAKKGDAKKPAGKKKAAFVDKSLEK